MNAYKNMNYKNRPIFLHWIKNNEHHSKNYESC